MYRGIFDKKHRSLPENKKQRKQQQQRQSGFNDFDTF